MIWQPIPGYEGYYEVSDAGDVRSVDRVVSTKRYSRRVYKGRLLKQLTDKDGYQKVKLCKAGQQEYTHAHRLVMRAFVGAPPSGQQVCHKDGNPANNKLTNLRYGTVRSNHMDKHLHGTMPIAAACTHTVLTKENVIDIRDRYAAGGIRLLDLANEFGVTKSTVARVVNGTSWRHVDHRLPSGKEEANK